MTTLCSPRSARFQPNLLDAVLLLLVLGLALPVVFGAVRQMSDQGVFFSAAGPVLPPPRVAGLVLLHPASPPASTPAAALAAAVTEAEHRGFVVGPPRRGGLQHAPALLQLRDGGGLLLLDRKGSTCLVYDPRRGEGVTDLGGLQPGFSGTLRPLTPAAPEAAR